MGPRLLISPKTRLLWARALFQAASGSECAQNGMIVSTRTAQHCDQGRCHGDGCSAPGGEGAADPARGQTTNTEGLTLKTLALVSRGCPNDVSHTGWLK